MRFGIFDHMEFRSGSLEELYDERLTMLELADRAGFWCYHKAEHHFVRLDAAPSSNVFMAALSQRTSRLRFGSLVYLLPFYEPLRLVEEVCTIDHLSKGRLEVGVGKGISPAEHSLWGHEPDDAREHFEEVFEILRKALTEEVLTHQGERYRYDDVVIPLRSRQAPHPPLWYPGNFDYAGRHRLNTIVGGPVPMVAGAVKSFRELVRDAETDWNPGVAEPTIGVTRHLYLAPTDEEALRTVRRAYPVYHENLAYLFKKYDVPFDGIGDPSFGGDVDAAIGFEGLVAGSPRSVIEHIERLRDEAGVDYFVGAFAWGDLSHDEACSSLRLFADEVMPAFAGS